VSEKGVTAYHLEHSQEPDLAAVKSHTANTTPDYCVTTSTISQHESPVEKSLSEAASTDNLSRSVINLDYFEFM
jgi:hypothetical protein